MPGRGLGTSRTTCCQVDGEIAFTCLSMLPSHETKLRRRKKLNLNLKHLLRIIQQLPTYTSKMDDGVRPLASNPLAELPVKNSRYIKECTELYLGHRGITYLKGFERFVNLESLWINDNSIRYIEGLSANFRIRSLYAQGNKISDLPNSCISIFKFLHELQIFDNAIAGLDATLEVLSKFRHLETLSLFGNPVAEEPNYRIKVISEIPSLRVLDNRRVTDEERAIGRKIVRDAKRRERVQISGGRRNSTLGDSATVCDKDKGQSQGGPASIVAGGNEGATRRLLTPEELVRDRSSCVQLLRSQVFAIQRAEKRKQRDQEQAKVSAVHRHRQAQREAPIPLPKFLDFAARRRNVCARTVPSKQESLGEWQIYRLRRLIDNVVSIDDASSNANGEPVLSKVHVRATLEEMERQVAWRLTNVSAVLDALFPLRSDPSFETDAVEEEPISLVSREAAMLALTGRSSNALANDSGSLGKATTSNQLSGLVADGVDISVSSSTQRPMVLPVWNMCSAQDCRAVARSAHVQLDQLSAKLSLLQGRSSSMEDGEEAAQSVELYRSIMEKASLASRLLSLAKERETSSPGREEEGTNGSSADKKTNHKSKSRRRNVSRSDTIQLVTYPEPPEGALRQNVDVCDTIANPEAKERLMSKYGLQGQRYERFMTNKRAQVNLPAVWTSYNI
jgi:hypothetical protein